MAIGRLSVVVGARGKASPHAEYIAREGKYEKDESIEKLEATGHGNMPQWAEHEPNFFWKMSDNYERKNGTSYREHVISLPRELTVDQRHELIKEWIKQEIGERHAYQYAIHNPPALDGGEQPHAHIMFSERLRDGIDRDPDSYFKRYNSKNPESGGSKKANTPKLAAERKLELKQQRDRWEKMCNTHLELAGSDAKISMKSLKAQNIKREPTNFTMSEIQDETIRKSYIDTLEAKKEVLSVIPSQDALVKEIKTQQDLKTDEFTQSLKDDYELERIELLVDEHYKQQEVQAEQERKALLAAQQKAAQAEQERKALLAAQQKAAQAEQERKALLAAQQKAAQAEQERKA
ncbi:MobA/MobL family protein, partial [Shewanella electrodiphila]